MRTSALHFTPKDQIILLAGLLADERRRAQIWALPQLVTRIKRLSEAGLIDAGELTDPTGVAAASRLRHITLDDLLDEHLPEHTP